MLLAIAMHYFQQVMNKYYYKRKDWFESLDVNERDNYKKYSVEMLHSYVKGLGFLKWILVVGALITLYREIR